MYWRVCLEVFQFKMPLTFDEFIQKYKDQKWNFVHIFESVENKTCKCCDYYVPICVYCNLDKYSCKSRNQLLEEKIDIERERINNRKMFVSKNKSE